MLYNIYAGLGGSFGGANYIGTMDCENEEKASDCAYEYACEEYDSYGGMYGLFSPDDAYDNPEDYGLSENPTEEEVEELWREDKESWIDYYVIPTDEDTIDADEIERLD